MVNALICLVGIAVLFAAALALSLDRARINWRTVGLAFALQFLLAGIILYFPPGVALLEQASLAVGAVLGYAREGIEFMFGDAGTGKLGFIFAFQVLPSIIFMSSLISVLYYTGIMQWIVRLIGGSLSRLLGTTAPESLSAAANIFIGQTEAPISIRPFLAGMTRSELFAVMVGGMATVAGSAMAGYAAIGIELKYLIAASFMAAPGALAMAKLTVPETDTPKADVTATAAFEDDAAGDEPPVNLIDAAAKGASSGLLLAVNVGAMLVAFIALIALVNGGIGWLTSLVGIEGITIEYLLGLLFSPIAWLLGVPWAEVQVAGSYIGQKLVLNEFVAYLDFVANRDTMATHTQAVVIFALCGFANFASIAILLGGLGMMAPSRRPEIARLGVRALIAATLANLMSAAIASFFLHLGAL
ncbi:MAG: NupC/NupG family nucleoside CNT transporter [Pseudomonadota bacterium]